MPFGSGSALLGGGDQALQEAISRRNQGQGGATGMVSPASPNFQPGIQQPPVSGGSPMPPVSGGQPISSASAGVPTPQNMGGLPAETPEAVLILKALSSRLSSLSKISETQQGVQ